MTAPPRQTMLATAPVSKLIWTFAIPAILSQVVNSMHNIVDQTFLGWGIGDLAIAATNIAFPLSTLTTALAALISRSFFADSSIHALRFLSLLLRLLSFDFSLCILLAQAGQYFDIPELGTYSTPHTVQFLGFNAVHRFVGVICNSPTKPMNL